MSASISARELRKLLGQKQGLALLDVRTPSEFDEAHVHGARLVPLDKLVPEVLVSSGVSKEEELYILCQRGGRASKAAQQLAQAGFLKPVVVEGGTEAWITEGFPVERSGRKAVSLERQVRIAAGSLVLTGVVLGFGVHPGFWGISAFVGAGLVFAGITDWCGMGLLLAKAPWNQGRR